jgi:hypothetical protein
MAPAASDPQYLVQAPAASVAPKNYRLSRRMAEATSTARRACLSPPQTNVVQLDGRKGVLMSVLKIGSASTSTSFPGPRIACR